MDSRVHARCRPGRRREQASRGADRWRSRLRNAMRLACDATMIIEQLRCPEHPDPHVLFVPGDLSAALRDLRLAGIDETLTLVADSLPVTDSNRAALAMCRRLLAHDSFTGVLYDAAFARDYRAVFDLFCLLDCDLGDWLDEARRNGAGLMTASSQNPTSRPAPSPRTAGPDA